MVQRLRLAVLLGGVLVAVVLAGVMGSVAAQPDPENPPDVTIETANTTISSSDNPPEQSSPYANDSVADDRFFETTNSLFVADRGGSMYIECDGEVVDGHVCDKGGVLETDVISITYDGVMGGTISAFEYWFDDDLTISIVGEEGDVEFDCYDMSFDHLHCLVDGERADDTEIEATDPMELISSESSGGLLG